MGVESVRKAFEPYQVVKEMAGEDRQCRNMGGCVGRWGERAEKSREGMGNMRGRGASLAVWVK